MLPVRTPEAINTREKSLVKTGRFRFVRNVMKFKCIILGQIVPFSLEIRSSCCMPPWVLASVRAIDWVKNSPNSSTLQIGVEIVMVLEIAQFSWRKISYLITWGDEQHYVTWWTHCMILNHLHKYHAMCVCPHHKLQCGHSHNQCCNGRGLFRVCCMYVFTSFLIYIFFGFFDIL